ncbi:hypothetical protein M758_UG170600 [Ceratodon purpureus]|nr:hypothetical protein M758_UG170600 [Ceratodon purpureus]
MFQKCKGDSLPLCPLNLHLPILKSSSQWRFFAWTLMCSERVAQPSITRHLITSISLMLNLVWFSSILHYAA